jgi:Raf kinase inhibitor-like YbhB/YbcL family protein
MSDENSNGLIVTSPAFQDNQLIPVRYTCDGEKISPPVNMDGIPEGTRSLVVIMEDPDVPMPQLPLFTVTHWIVYNIPPEAPSVPETVPASAILEGEVMQGIATNRKNNYIPPCPIAGIHRYCFHAYAIDTMLEINPEKATKKNILKSMEGHILARGLLIGRYKRQRK